VNSKLRHNQSVPSKSGAANDDSRGQRTLAIRAQIREFLARRHWPDDPALAPQYAEMVAVELWNQLAEEQRAQAEAIRRTGLQGQFCAGLAVGMNRTDATVAVGVASSTVYRWLKDPSFLDAVRDAERTGAPFRLRPRTGRQVKLGPRTRGAILRRIRQGGTRAQAAEAAGVSRQTLYTWLKRFEDFRAAVLAAEQDAR
jgi:transposase